jgi:hypothetical protein
MAKRTKRAKQAASSAGTPVTPAVPLTVAASKVASSPEKIPKYEGENFTSPTILRSRELAPKGAPARRAFGCMERLTRTAKGGVSRKFTGERCKGTITMGEDGQQVCSTQPFRDLKCSSGTYAAKNVPCAGGRFNNLTPGSRCPVQLAWLDGIPVLRLCSAREAQGELVRVKSAEDARTQAQKLCTFWRENGTWEGVGNLVEGRQAGLGKARKKRARKARS